MKNFTLTVIPAALLLSFGLGLHACSGGDSNPTPPLPDSGLVVPDAAPPPPPPDGGDVTETDGSVTETDGSVVDPSADCLSGKTYLEILNQGAECFPLGAAGVPFDNARVQHVLRPISAERPHGLPLPTEGLP